VTVLILIDADIGNGLEETGWPVTVDGEQGVGCAFGLGPIRWGTGHEGVTMSELALVDGYRLREEIAHLGIS
tara:strand:- start:254 stop:469 length:216 start_codon:yes stop_codon:yes gene_type:complete